MAFKWLRIKVLELGITLKVIADEANIEYTRFSKIINGYQRSDKDFIKKVKGALEQIEQHQMKGVK